MLSVDEIADILRPIFKRLSVQKAILFGSRARGRATERSDIDLIIVTETTDRFFKRYDRFMDIYAALREEAVDLLIYTPGELEAISHRDFIKRALAEGQVLYES